MRILGTRQESVGAQITTRKVRRRQCAVDGKKRLISHVGFLPAVALIFALSGAATATAQDNTAYGDNALANVTSDFQGDSLSAIMRLMPILAAVLIPRPGLSHCLSTLLAVKTQPRGDTH